MTAVAAKQVESFRMTPAPTVSFFRKFNAALPVAFLLVVWAVVYIPGLFRPALLDDADSVHAEAAREILARSDWVTLHVNGIRYLEKAPLMYWSIAASFRAFGVSEWSARLPLALGVLALLLATYRLGSRHAGREAGFYASLVLATAFGPYIFTRILIPDIFVGLWLTLAFDFFLQGMARERPARGSCWGLAAAAALGVLTKGLIGLVFVAATAGSFLIVTGNLPHLRRMRLASSAAVFLAIAAPWHLLAGLRNPAQGDVRGFFWFYFVNEQFLRYLNKRIPLDYDTVPLALFWGLTLIWLLPWCLFLPPALAQIPFKWRTLRSRAVSCPGNERPMGQTERLSLLLGIWACVILLFFSFSTRQEYYTLPALPALALLVGVWLQREAQSPAGSPVRRIGIRCSAIFRELPVTRFTAPAGSPASWHA